MRNQRLVLILAILVLLIGGGLAGYLALSNQDEGGKSGRVPDASIAGTPERTEQESPDNRNAATQAGAGMDAAKDSSSRMGEGPTIPTDQARASGGDSASKSASDVTGTPVGSESKPAESTPEDWTESWPSKTTEFVITGKITYKADGRPAAGAAISADKAADFFAGSEDARPAISPPAQKIEGSTVSDGGGEFTLRLSITRKVPPGPEDTSDEAKGARSMHDPAVYVQVVGKLAGYAPARSPQLELHEGKEAKVSLTLAVPASITGRVVDAVTRAGIEGADVELYSSDFTGGVWNAPRRAKTGKDGFFSVTDLPAANYMCGAGATGYADVSAWESGKSADLSKGGEQDIGEIALLKAGTIAGTVVDATTGQPIKGATVEASAGTQFGNFAQESGVTGEDGRFELKNAAAGQYTVTAKAQGYAPGKVEKVGVESGATIDVGAIKLGLGFALEGTVKDTKGNPVAAASVIVREHGAGTPWIFGNETLGSGVTDEQGKFSITGLAEGKAKVEVTATGYARAEREVDLKPGMAPVDLVMGKGASVRGRVLTGAGAPASSVAVGLVNHNNQFYQIYKLQPAQFLSFQNFGDGAVQAHTGQDGRFTLQNVPEGTFLLMAVPEGGKGAARDDIKVADGQDIDIGDIQLPGPGAAIIRVTEEGQPVSGLKVELRSAAVGLGLQGTSHPSAETDGSGAANFSDIAAGEYLVRTARDKETWDSDLYEKRRIKINTGQTTEFKLELKPANTVRVHGRLTLDGKAVFKSIYLVGYGSRAGLFKDTKPDETGFYEFVPPVELGTYVIHARVGDKEITCPIALNLDKAGDTEVTRDFAARAISGTVTTPQGTPTERASVRMTLHRIGGETPEQFAQWMGAELRCDAEGRYRFEHVPAGSYRVTASLEGIGSVGRDVNMAGSDAGGVDLTVAANGGTLRVTIKKLHGTLPPQSFGLVQVKDQGGHVLDFGSQGAGFFMPADNAQVELPTIPAGTYTVIISASACLPLEKTGVAITKDKRTELEIDLTVGAELHLGVTNTEITQAMLDAAKVTYHDAQGNEVAIPKSVFDSWNTPAAPEKPTLRARYIGPTVALVKVKVAGYAEIAVAIEFEAGKRIVKTESLFAE